MLKPSLQQDQDDYDWDDYERDYETYEIEQEHDSVTIVPVPRIFEQQQEYDKSDTKVSVLEEIRNISVDKGSDLVLTCLPNGNVCKNAQMLYVHVIFIFLYLEGYLARHTTQ